MRTTTRPLPISCASGTSSDFTSSDEIHAAADTSFSLPSAAVMTLPAILGSSQATRMLPDCSSHGMTFKFTVCMTPNVPNDPDISFDKSKPVTFFITRPPDLKSSARPETASNPNKWSRAAPTLIRRGPAILVATRPPMVPASGTTSSLNRAGKFPGSK